MTPGLLERTRTELDSVEKMWSQQTGDERELPLREDVAESKASANARIAAPTKTVTERAAVSEDDPITFKVETSKTATPSTFQLRSSLRALGKARSSSAPEDWLEAAAVMKCDAVRLRRTRYTRHAAVLLALADVFTYTEPTSATLDASSRSAIERGIAVLSEPFITTEAEEGFLTELLTTGWHLAPATSPVF